jgi:hypothetical protein
LKGREEGKKGRLRNLFLALFEDTNTTWYMLQFPDSTIFFLWHDIVRPRKIEDQGVFREELL